MGPSKSPGAEEYWRSKVNTPPPADGVEVELELRRSRGMAGAMVLCTLLLCITAVIVAVIAT